MAMRWSGGRGTRMYVKRCIWCSRRLWPWQQQSPGMQMHLQCSRDVELIVEENQRQVDLLRREYIREQSEDSHFQDPEWQRWQADLRWKEEDRL